MKSIEIFMPSAKTVIRYKRMIWGWGFLTVLLIVRIGWLQSENAAEYAKTAAGNRLSDVVLEYGRGEVLDRNKKSLTDTTEKTEVLLKTRLILENVENTAIVSNAFHISKEELTQKLRNTKGPVVLEANADTLKKLEQLDKDAYTVVKMLNRYEADTVAPHVTGYLNKADGSGAAGLEKYYNNILDVKGYTYAGYVQDAAHRPVDGLGYRIGKTYNESEKKHLQLTLDCDIQKIAGDILQKSGFKGAIVVEKVESGDILALASNPEFDRNNVARYLEDPDKALFCRATAAYNLGSVFKIIDVASILEEDPNYNAWYTCNGSIFIGAKEFKCASHKIGGHGEVDLSAAFARSCNPYFIHEMTEREYLNLITMANKFGLGEKTGLEEQGLSEAAGNMPKGDKGFSQAEIANTSIGQGEVTATPLQAVKLASIIANDGIKRKTNLVEGILDDSGNKIQTIKQEAAERVISETTAKKIKEFMHLATEENGTGVKANMDEYGGAAGKTGTAQTGVYEGDREITNGWFSGFFPYENPQYAVCVFVEDVSTGTETPSSIFKDVAKSILER